MAAKNWTLKITGIDPFAYNPQPPAAAGGYELKPNGTITITTTIPDATIKQVDIYADNGSNQRAGDALGTWISAMPSYETVEVYSDLQKTKHIYSIQGSSTSVVITDLESLGTGEEEKYHFCTTITVGSTDYPGDPEMINKSGGN